MLFLSETEKSKWKEMVEEIMAGGKGPDKFNGDVCSNLLPMFHYYIGTLLTAKKYNALGIEWLRTGTMLEEEGLLLNAFLIGFLERHQGELVPPYTCFADPRPFLHFAGVPTMKKSRENFIKHTVDAMPMVKKPFRFMDIGCGDGGLTAWLLKQLRQAGKIGDVGEILLIDSSPAMIELARKTLEQDFPSSVIKTINSKIQDVSEKLDHKYDLAISSLAYHHMPLEKKRIHLKNLKPWIDNFVLFELDANNDTPELYTPELAASTYQSYGRIIDFVFSHDGDVEVAQASVDSFLMTENISFLTQPRGVRSDYHMLRHQWKDLFGEILGDEFTCLMDSTAYSDEFMDLFTMCYGR